jgi:hypothetical protein
MPYIIIAIVIILAAAAIVTYIISTEAKERRESYERFCKSYGHRRLQLADKVVINKHFYARPGCFGIVNKEIKKSFEDVIAYAYEVKVYINEKHIEDITISGDLLSLVTEDKKQ